MFIVVANLQFFLQFELLVGFFFFIFLSIFFFYLIFIINFASSSNYSAITNIYSAYQFVKP